MTIPEIISRLRTMDLFADAYQIASEHRLTVEEMLSPSRVRPRPEARRAFVARLARQGMTQARIAEILGCGRDVAAGRLRVKR